MKLVGINLNNIKVVIFDFDDTLAIHNDKDFSKKRRESEDKYLNYYLNAYKVEKRKKKIVIKKIKFFPLFIRGKSQFLYNF